MPPGFHIEVIGRLDQDETDAVTLLVERATEADGVRPLSEHSTLHLRHGGDPGIRHLLAYGDARGDLPHLAGFGHLDITDEVAGSSAEVVVDPALVGTGTTRVSGLFTDDVEPSAAGSHAGLTATADAVSGKATMFTIVLRPAP